MLTTGTNDPIGPIDHARVLRIALPIVAANVTVPLIGVVDTAVVGQLGEAAPIGAVGLGAVILSAVYWLFGFLRMGTTGLAAQARGAGNEAEAAAVLQRGLLIAALAGLGLILLQKPFFGAGFAIAPASAEVEALTRDYLSIRIWAAPATIALYALTGWLIAAERTRAVLALQLVMNGLNVFLDVLFVPILGWGVSGVAAASVVAELVGLVFGLWLCRHAVRCRMAGITALTPLRHIAAVNSNILLRSALLQASFTGFLFVSAGIDDVVLAANQVLMQFLSLMAFALDGFAFAAEALVGQAVGARAQGALKRAVVLSSAWAFGTAGAISAVYALGGTFFISQVTAAPEVQEAARAMLPFAALSPIIAVASFQLDGIFIGATRTAEMRDAMVLATGIFAVSAFVGQHYGNAGLWAALLVFYAARALSLLAFWPRVEAAARR